MGSNCPILPCSVCAVYLIYKLQFYDECDTITRMVPSGFAAGDVIAIVTIFTQEKSNSCALKPKVFI